MINKLCFQSGLLKKMVQRQGIFLLLNIFITFHYIKAVIFHHFDYYTCVGQCKSGKAF